MAKKTKSWEVMVVMVSKRILIIIFQSLKLRLIGQQLSSFFDTPTCTRELYKGIGSGVGDNRQKRDACAWLKGKCTSVTVCQFPDFHFARSKMSTSTSAGQFATGGFHYPPVLKRGNGKSMNIYPNCKWISHKDLRFMGHWPPLLRPFRACSTNSHQTWGHMTSWPVQGKIW